MQEARTSESARAGRVGRVIHDRCRILSLVARGRMGRVYAGGQLPLGRPLALKVMHPELGSEESVNFQRRFFFEAATCARLRHPNTVTLFDCGQAEDLY
jgi:serine/threonine-protein kinase